MRLIDVDQVIDAVDAALYMCKYATDDHWNLKPATKEAMNKACDSMERTIISLIKYSEEIQTIDAVQVVRCKDCKYYVLDQFCVNDMDSKFIICHDVCTKWGRGCKTMQDGFCFLGEKREDKDDTD